MNFGEYDRLCKQQEEKNKKYLKIFEQDLNKAGQFKKQLKSIFLMWISILTRICLEKGRWGWRKDALVG
ncbi:MAG: hypothetical protein GX215_09440 [Clostridiales Family XIII bacterium]|jgi:hypothetical protein|nr:hypothetical protein [Clostridiales Family XIII bacterium]